MLRNIAAVIVGLIVGNVWNMALIIVNSSVLFPMQEGASMQDPEQMKAYVASLPAQGFLLVLAAHVGQAGIGGWIAARMAKSRPMLLAGIIGALTFLGATYNLAVLGGPVWMWVDLPLIVAATWWAGTCGRKRLAADASSAE